MSQALLDEYYSAYFSQSFFARFQLISRMEQNTKTDQTVRMRLLGLNLIDKTTYELFNLKVH